MKLPLLSSSEIERVLQKAGFEPAPKRGISSKFIFYFIRRKKLRNLAKLHFTGTVRHKRVPKEFLINSKIPIPFRNGKPDLKTQKKIVEYIEANFSGIDRILEKKKKELEKIDEL